MEHGISKTDRSTAYVQEVYDTSVNVLTGKNPVLGSMRGQDFIFSTLNCMDVHSESDTRRKDPSWNGKKLCHSKKYIFQVSLH